VIQVLWVSQSFNHCGAMSAVEILSSGLPLVTVKLGSVEDVCAHAKSMKHHWMQLLDKHGGLVIWAPALTTPTSFELCMKELISLATEYPGGAPRKKVTDCVWTTTEFDSTMPIPAHTELSYMPKSRPELIAFYCEKPAPRGGMTPAVDMLAVAHSLPQDIICRFSPGIRTSLNMPPIKGRVWWYALGSFQPPFRFKPIPYSWKDLGETKELAMQEAMKKSSEDCMVEWDGDWMQKFITMPAVEEYRGQLVWTGFFPLFHWSGFAIQSMFDLCYHNRTLRQLITTTSIVLLTILCRLRLVLSRTPLVRQLVPPCPGLTSCTLQDGKHVSVWDIFRIVKCYNQHLMKWQWQPGQIALFDNRRLAHCRTPYNPASRLMYTAFGRRST